LQGDAGRKFGEGTWAVGGCNGIGRHIAQCLAADGEPVVDVPAKLSARARVFSAGQGRKADPVDAHSAALAGLAARSQTINRVRRLLLELLPGGARKFLSAAQARELLVGVRLRDIAGKTRRRLAAEMVTELTRIDKRIKAAGRAVCPGPAHHGHRRAAQRHRRPRLLSPQGRRRQTTMEAMRCLKRGLSDRLQADAHRRHTRPDGPGRTRGGDSSIQRG
jgi:hypothetical protein